MNFYILIKRAAVSRTANPILRIMKIVIIILMATMLQVSARSFAQIVSLHEKSASLVKIIKEIRKQTGYDFFYSKDLIENSKPVTIDVTNAQLAEVLEKCFADQPFSYEVVDKAVTIKEKGQSWLKKLLPESNNIDVHGFVIDSAGATIPGATIRVKNTNRLVITDKNGGFILKDVDKSAILEINYIGYAPKEAHVSGGVLYIRLMPSTSKLDQVNVIAYGTNTRRYDVGAVATVTAKDIEKQPVTNPLLALSGQVAGLNITQTSGTPGSQVLVQIRGQNTLQTIPGTVNKPYDQPLFIVDGVPFATQNNTVNQLSSLAGSNYNDVYGGLSPFNSINPLDIESISVLKDADATSIYGSQGANGVIIITTKKGKAGATNVSASVTDGINLVATPVDMMNTQQYLALRREGIKNDNITLTPALNSIYPDLLIFDQNRNINWYNQYFDKTTNNTDAHLSLSGGTNTTTYIVSTGYSRSDFDFPGDFADDRLTLHSAFHTESTNRRLTLDFGTDYAYDRNNSSISPSVATVLALPPNFPSLTNPNGTPDFTYKGVAIVQQALLDASLHDPSLFQSYSLNTTLRLSYKIVKGLSAGVNMGFSHFNTDENNSNPLAFASPYNKVNSANFATGDNQTINIEPQLNYNVAISKGVLTAVGGATYKKITGASTLLSGMNYANDSLLGSINGATTISASDNYSIYRYVAGFARMNYIYDQRYIVNLTGRRDGSSNFGPGKQFGNFGSAGVGWIFSEEGAVKSALPFLSFGKLTASYGTNGTDGVGPYLFQPFYTVNKYTPSFQGVLPYTPADLYNTGYSWATKRTLNLSADLGFFHDRVLLNTTFYRSVTGNQLVYYPLPSTAGLSNVIENLPATVEDKGWEFTLNTTNIKSKDFSWTSNFNISLNRNKLLAFPDLANSSYASTYVIGQSTSIVQGYRYKDVNPQTGLFEYYKANGTLSSTPTYGLSTVGGDFAPIADVQPKYFGGFGNTFTYKGFSLSVMFQFSKQTAENYEAVIYQNEYPGTEKNEPVQVLNHWKQPGDVSAFQRIDVNSTPSGNDFAASSGAYSDDTYLRLKNLSLAYALPQAWLKKTHISGAKLFVNAQNLLTITDYKVGDPEQPGQLFSIPIQRIVVCGLSLNL
jgi:TonB-linked SusC/RagA family outer membrane protein